MPKDGLEPSQGCPHWILNPARLPISPLRPDIYTINKKAFGSHYFCIYSKNCEVTPISIYEIISNFSKNKYVLSMILST